MAISDRILSLQYANHMSDPPFFPGPTSRTVRSVNGEILQVPSGWVLLRPGDATLTRRVKAAGSHWLVQEKKGRRTFSRGVWAPRETIHRVREELDAERSSDTYAKRRAAESRRREKQQAKYVEDFSAAVTRYLNFHERHAVLEQKMAHAVTQHATPVGSGTVARTKQISIDRRAEAAVIAWMRHRTTAYDNMIIARVRGKRREIRRMLAARSKKLLSHYRAGEPAAENCPLRLAISELP